MIRILLAIVIFANPAWATQDGWPALYDVSGVAADDVLNIRRKPSVGGEVIGTLAPTATAIEVIRDNDGHGTWGLVNFGEGTGWASLAFMARQPGQWSGAFPAIRQCFGTEPFWSLRHDDPELIFAAPEIPAHRGEIFRRSASVSRRDRFAFVGVLPDPEIGANAITLFLRTESCSDRMSDRAYGISVDVLLSGGSVTNSTGMFSGCCSIAPPAQ